jgi:Cu-Zn family superoxide dismutase
MKKILILGVLLSSNIYAKELIINVNAIDSRGVNDVIGTIKFSDNLGYLVLSTDLAKLPAGQRGFHIHEKPNCSPGQDKSGITKAGLGAGGHFDPHATMAHKGPNENKEGHLGDLYFLNVDENGVAKVTMEVKHIKSLDQIKNKAIVVHAGGDNYSDTPDPLGGGGARIACGVIK